MESQAQNAEFRNNPEYLSPMIMPLMIPANHNRFMRMLLLSSTHSRYCIVFNLFSISTLWLSGMIEHWSCTDMIGGSIPTQDLGNRSAMFYTCCSLHVIRWGLI